MSRKPSVFILCAFFLVVNLSCSRSEAQLERLLTLIDLPRGFDISLFAADVENARQIVLGDNGTVFVGSRRAGMVHALVDTNSDGVADRKHVIAQGLNMPSGLTFKDGSLYVGAVSTIYRYDNIESRLTNPPRPVVVTDRFPSERHHGWKYLGFGPDGKLYVPVGAPCNICDRGDPFATITRIDPNGSNLEIVARGVRNTVGFDWHPTTGELWFAENGRDMMGDNVPADELNRVSEIGQHFGFPYFHAGTVPDPHFGRGHSPDAYVKPAINLGPHVAAIGMKFYTGQMFPEQYRNQIFIAEHGSWNRSEKIGYRITLVRLEGNDAVSYEPFASGWLQGEEAWGRPADVYVMPDGALLVSDDKAHAIYRITYSE